MARRLFRDWETEVDARIEAIRAERTDKGMSLTRRQARALAGEWYEWFLARHPVSRRRRPNSTLDIRLLQAVRSSPARRLRNISRVGLQGYRIGQQMMMKRRVPVCTINWCCPYRADLRWNNGVHNYMTYITGDVAFWKQSTILVSLKIVAILGA